MPDEAVEASTEADGLAPLDAQKAPDPDPDERLDRLVDLQSAGSFPASDPPSSWAGA